MRWPYAAALNKSTTLRKQHGITKREMGEDGPRCPPLICICNQPVSAQERSSSLHNFALLLRVNELVSIDDQCRCAFGLKQEAHLQWTWDCSRVNWEEFLCCKLRANETYSEAKHLISVTNGCSYERLYSTLINSGSLLIKSAVFSSRSSLPTLVSGGGGLM